MFKLKGENHCWLKVHVRSKAGANSLESPSARVRLDATVLLLQMHCTVGYIKTGNVSLQIAGLFHCSILSNHAVPGMYRVSLPFPLSYFKSLSR